MAGVGLDLCQLGGGGLCHRPAFAVAPLHLANVVGGRAVKGFQGQNAACLITVQSFDVGCCILRFERSRPLKGERIRLFRHGKQLLQDPLFGRVPSQSQIQTRPSKTKLRLLLELDDALHLGGKVCSELLPGLSGPSGAHIHRAGTLGGIGYAGELGLGP